MADAVVSDVLESIYAAALDPGRWPEALEQLSQAVGGLGTLILPLHVSSGIPTIQSASLDESTEAYRRDWWRYDCRSEAGKARNVTSGIFTDHDVLDANAMRRDPFYQEFLRPHGLGAFICNLSMPTPHQVVSVSVQRELRRGDFERSEMDRFALLGSHAARAIAISTKLTDVLRINRSLLSAMDHLAFGTIVLKADRTVAFVNNAARALLGRTMMVRSGRIVASNAANQRLLDGVMESAMKAGAGLNPSSILLSRAREGLAPLHIQALPISGDTSERLEMVALGPGVLLLLHDLGANSAHGVGHHLIQLGLTPGQARVAEAVGSGLTPREAAAKWGLSEGTVRTVLKAVFERLGVSRQSQLAVLVTRLRALP